MGGVAVFRVPDPGTPLDRGVGLIVPRRAFRMRLEFPPPDLHQQLFREADLAGAGEIHRFIPRRRAVRAAVWAVAVRLAFAIELPDTIGAVRVANGATEQRRPRD